MKTFSQSDSLRLNEEQAKEKADKIFERIVKGENFAALAILYSEDPGTAKAGGDLGWTNRGVLVPAFEEVAFNLNPGETAPPVKTEFGFHIIQLIGKNENAIHALHILIRFNN